MCLRKVYAAAFKTGGCFLRPYMLGFRRDFGYSSMCEPEQMILLAQLFLQEGFFGLFRNSFKFSMIGFQTTL